MAYSLTLPSRSKAHRIRLAQDEAEPDFSVPKLIAWCGSNLSRKEMLDLCDDLLKLANEAEDDADPTKNVTAEQWKRASLLGAEDRGSARLGMDRLPGGGRVNTRDAEAEFRKMFPDAKPLAERL